MAKGDFQIKDVAGANTVPTQEWQTEANTTVPALGEPVKMKTDGTGLYVILCADGDGVIGTTSKLAGICADAGTQTTAANGVVNVYLPQPGIVYSAKPKVAGSANTAAKIAALDGKRVVLDLTTGSFTIDTAAADGATNAFVIVGGDPTLDRVFFIIRTAATIYA